MLTELQARVVRLFFGLSESVGFVLAGGGALVVRHEVDRSTNDVDFFVDDQQAVGQAANALEAALLGEGFEVERVRDYPTYVRFEVQGDGSQVEVDLGYDFRWRPAEISEYGPVLSSEELAVDKLLCLFGRAEARDFVDAFFLARRHGIEQILRWAPEKDEGFSRYYLAVNLERFDRRPRTEFDVDDETFTEMTNFFADLRARLMREVLDSRS